MASTSFTSRDPVTVRCKRLVPKRSGGEKVSDRQERIAGWNQQRLCSGNVVVQGAGGIGSWISHALVKQGAGEVHVCDPDVVQPSNLSRQEFAADDLFKPKAIRLVQRLAQIGVQGTVLTGYPLYFSEFLSMYCGPRPDVVVSGVDNNEARLQAAQWCRAIKSPLVCAGVAQDASGAYLFIQEPGKACLGCYLGTHMYKGRAACPGTPAVVDVLLLVAGYASYAITSLLMNRQRTWNGVRFSLSTAECQALSVPVQARCPMCKGSGG